jgi:hypothetical protein
MSDIFFICFCILNVLYACRGSGYGIWTRVLKWRLIERSRI